MPHVDEGTLHAYLDGAVDVLAQAGALPAGVTRASIESHLALCADCRALLDAEREIRERAGVVLQDAAPAHAEPPAFELAHQPVQRRRTWVPLTWAATLLMAVGAGWWGREIATIADVTPVTVQESARPQAQQPEEAPAGRDAVAPVAPPEIAAGGSAAADHAAANQPTVEAAAPPPPVASVQGAGTSMQQNEVARARTEPAPLREEAARRGFAAAPAAAPAPPPMAQLDVVAQAPADLVLARTRSGDTRWAEPRADAREALLARAFRVQQGSAPELRAAAQPGYAVVRTRQRLEDGTWVDVVSVTALAVDLQGLAATGAAEERVARVQGAITVEQVGFTRLDDGINEVRVRVPERGSVVAVRGALDEDRLRALARTLVPLR